MMEYFMNNLPKFNNSLSDLLFHLLSIKTVSFKSFLLLQIAKNHCFQQFYGRNIFVTLFKLYRPRWLGCAVIQHSVDMVDLVDDAVHHFFK